MPLKKPGNKIADSTPEPEVITKPEDETVAVEATEAAVDEPSKDATGTEVAEVEAVKPDLNTELKTAPSKPTGTAVAASKGFEQDMADQGFEGLHVGYYSYINVKLDKGKFVTSDGDDLEEEAFTGRLLGSKAKFAYTNGNDEDSDCVFSYDKETSTDGQPVEPVLAEWRAKDMEVTMKQYADVTMEVLSGTLAGEVVLLSVAPSSVPKLAGYMGRLNYKNLDLKNVVTEVSCGPKVIPKNPKNSYYPWAFKQAS